MLSFGHCLSVLKGLTSSRFPSRDGMITIHYSLFMVRPGQRASAGSMVVPCLLCVPWNCATLGHPRHVLLQVWKDEPWT